MQENDGRAFTFVMIGDPDTVKGSKSVHSAPLNTGRPHEIFASLRRRLKNSLVFGLRKAHFAGISRRPIYPAEGDLSGQEGTSYSSGLKRLAVVPGHPLRG